MAAVAISVATVKVTKFHRVEDLLSGGFFVIRMEAQGKMTESIHISDSLRKRLLRLAGRFVSSTDLSIEAADIVQEAMARLWMMEQDGRQIRNMDALATTITKNICISHYRKREIRTEQIESDEQPGGEGAESRIEDAESAATKKRLMGRLTDSQRLYMTMRNDYGLSLDEIAARTGKPKTSIKTTLSNARRLLLEELKKEEA